MLVFGRCDTNVLLIKFELSVMLARIIHQPFYCGLKYLQNQNLSTLLACHHSGAMARYLSP